MKRCIQCGKPIRLAGSTKLCSPECRAARHKAQLAEWRLAHGFSPSPSKCVVCNHTIPDHRRSRRMNTCCGECNRMKRNLAASLSKKRAYELPEIRRKEIARALARYYESHESKRRPIGQQLAILEKALIERMKTND